MGFIRLIFASVFTEIYVRKLSQLLELDKKLSTNDSNQRPQSDGSANVMDYNLNNITQIAS